jgi:beta-lactamase class D
MSAGRRATSPGLATAALALSLIGACAHRPDGAPASRGWARSEATRTGSCFLLYEMGVGEVRRSPAATMLGLERERAYLAKCDYGNQDTSSGLTTFWLSQSLRISPDEQETFMLHLYQDALPVSEKAMRTVREILVQPTGVVVNAAGEHSFDAPWPGGTVVSAKTGSSDDVRWLVGHVERQRRSWVFVSCVTGRGLAPLAAIDLAAQSLRAAQVL